MARLCSFRIWRVMQIANTTEKLTKSKNMESNKNNWTLGEIATLPQQEKPLVQSGSTAYVHYITSRYVCIREATDGQRGILVKVLGKACGDQVGLVKGKPFCKDDHDELVAGHRYYSFPFPSAKDVREAIDIIKGNQGLLQKFEAASMHINPNSTFWVSDTVRSKLFLKKPQILNGCDYQLYPPNEDDYHYRLSIVYFFKGSLVW